MRLVWFEITSYKRFAERNKVNLDGKLIAVVGPNESGKTSLLRSLQHLNDRTEFVAHGGSQEITRGVELADNTIVAEWTFALDDDDRSSLDDIPEAKALRWFILSKHRNGKVTSRLTPHVRRDQQVRRNVRSKVQAFASSPTDPIESAEDEAAGTRLKLVEQIAAHLERDDDNLTAASLADVEELILQLETGGPTAQELARNLRVLHEHESVEAPATRAAGVLEKRKPQFLLFDAEDRNLLSEYDLQSYFVESTRENKKRGLVRTAIPRALSNLAAAAGLDLEALYMAQKQDDRGRVRTILENAEHALSESLRDSWTQSLLSLSLELDGWRLQILLKSTKGEYVRIVERSDGLRQFLAMLLFLSRQPKDSVRPIVLIDEAERHLHYDAQADLVQMLTTQSLASQVIYTTHSLGCLPEDLGWGVRMVAFDDPHSRIDNWFWTAQRPGFSPLLFATGANTMAFLPMRYALISEGAADMILLPCILKEVLGRDALGFQVAPGLASATAGEIALLNNEAARTAYLTDGDDAGRRIRAKLREAGIPHEQILSLSVTDHDETVIEDYTHIESYVNAVNEELRRSGEARITSDDLSRPNRPKRLEEWCAQRELTVPSKRAVAYRLVEAKYEHQVADPACAPQIRELYRMIAEALRLP